MIPVCFRGGITSFPSLLNIDLYAGATGPIVRKYCPHITIIQLDQFEHRFTQFVR
jgi:hypothetical protein